MNFVYIIEGIERLVVSLLFWIIFIPKSIYKIVTDPKWVGRYVTVELEKDTDRFKDYMSPIILYLLNSVFLVFVYIFIKRDVLKDIDAVSKTGGSSIWDKIVAGLDISGDMMATLSGSYGFVAAIVFLSFPLFFGLIIELLKGVALSRDALRRATYIQCYYFSPMALTFLLIIFSSSLLEEIEQNLIVFVYLIFCVWFTITQIKFIAKELRKSIFTSTLFYFGIFIGICLCTYGVISVFIVFDEDKSKVKGGIYELTATEDTTTNYTIIIKCISCNNDSGKLLKIDGILTQSGNIPDPEFIDIFVPEQYENDTIIKVPKSHKKYNLKLEITEDLGHDLYIDILDNENYSIIGGIKSKKAMWIRKIVSYFIILLLGVIVVIGVKSLFKKVYIK